MGGETAASRAANAPAFYVYNNTAGKGFVVVAGDDCAKPILMYSFDTNIDMNNLPPNCKAWMEGLRSDINEAREQGATPLPNGTWDAAADEKGNVMEYIETASWNQGTPYNNQTPTYTQGGKQVHYVTGCVATATCIVMKHHAYPTKGTGTIPAYTTRSDKFNVPSRTLGETYDWNNMPMKYTSGYTTEQGNQVARLMADVGAALEMDYGEDGSGAYSSDIPGVLTTYFDFDKSVKYMQKAYYSETQWNKILQDELEAGRPMVYAGDDPEGGGHAFVLDGYTDRNYYHFNWGWGGSSNCYTLLSVMDAGGYNFTDGQEVVLNIKPNEGGTAPLPELLFSSYYADAGLVASCTTFAQNTTFTVTAKYFFNYGTVAMTNLNFAIALANANGMVKQLVSSTKSTSSLDMDYGWKSSEFSCKITTAIEDGDVLMLVYKMDGLAEWTKVRGSVEAGCVDAIPVVVEKPGLKFDAGKSSAGLTVSSATFGLDQSFSVTASNCFNMGTEAMKNVKIAIALASSSGEVKQLVSSVKTHADASLSPGNGWESVRFDDCTIPSTANVANGDVLIMVYQMDGLAEWTKVKGDGIKGVDAIAVAISLEKSISMAYDKTAKRVTLTTALDNVGAKLYKAGKNGKLQEVTGVVSKSGNTITVNTSSLTSGTNYTLRITRGTTTRDITLIF